MRAAVYRDTVVNAVKTPGYTLRRLQHKIEYNEGNGIDGIIQTAKKHKALPRFI